MKGYHAITPYVTFTNAAAARAFYKTAFAAEEIMWMTDPSGGLIHGEIKVGDSPIMMSEESAAWPDMRSALSIGNSPVSFFLYVDDADAWFQRAIQAGAKEVMALADKEYGRTGGVKDPFGLTWWLTTPPKDTK